ncbi:hypothetical protein C8N26_0561 [Tenacibaculum lutimaris]|uniref:Uncharacterized protein n=1 Tax=Tenacibaculum lutimaris TaxID=285258 RepID=A0A420E542_9FLAO|nr:hypothetical protein [Tenacibaculum lutimaris]RKF05160.1 hypothetical protein C8N26_0561 [Tenacibaculum lutimaris]
MKKEIRYKSQHDNWISKLYLIFSIRAKIFMPQDPWILKIYLKNGGSWEYETSHKPNNEFNTIIKQLKNQIR